MLYNFANHRLGLLEIWVFKKEKMGSVLQDGHFIA